MSATTPTVPQTITETPAYKKEWSFYSWVSNLETEFQLKNITDDETKRKWLQLKFGMDNAHIAPLASNFTSYDAFKAALASRLPRDKSDTEKVVQFGLHKPTLTRRGLESLATLTLSTFNDKSETYIVSEFCGKILREPLTSLQRYVVEGATSETLMDALEKIVKAFPETAKPTSTRTSSKCTFCGFPGHSESVCRIKEKNLPQKDYYSEKLARQNVVKTEAVSEN